MSFDYMARADVLEYIVKRSCFVSTQIVEVYNNVGQSFITLATLPTQPACLSHVCMHRCLGSKST